MDIPTMPNMPARAPQAVRAVPGSRGIPRVATPGAASSGGRGGALPQVDIAPDGAGVNAAAPRLLKKREKMLIAGDSISGKSYTWATMADEEYQKDANWETVPNPDYNAETPVVDGVTIAPTVERYIGPKFFIHDTDGGAPALLDPDEGEFPHLSFTVGGNVYPFPSYDWAASVRTAKALLDKGPKGAKGGDWIFVDVVNRLYDQAQVDLATRRGFSLDNMVVARGLANKGFGAFEPNDWNLVKRIHDAIFGQYMFGTEANVVLLAHVRDMIDTPNRAPTRERLMIYDQVGVQPMGAEAVTKLADTIIILWSKRYIERGEHNARVSARNIRYMHVVKDRGKPFAVRIEMTKAFWPSLRDVRRTGAKPVNTTSEEVAALGLVEDQPDVPSPRDPNAPEIDTDVDELDDVDELEDETATTADTDVADDDGSAVGTGD